MTLADYPSATVSQLRAALDRWEVSAEALLDTAIARIERLDAQLNAVVVRDFGRARAAARRADAALRAGERAPLLGVPITVKESFAVEGLTQTWGVEAFRNAVSTEDAVAVARLRGAGAVILGKTNVPTMLGDWQTNNPIYGRTNNPWDAGRSAGGSSGGSAAALAAGFTSLELGSDIGGSIRVPAALCGVVGHKPTYGIAPTRGHEPDGVWGGLEPPLGVVGPLARTAEDARLGLEIIAGPDREQAVGWRLALPPARRTRLADFRVLLLDRHPAAATDSRIVGALHGLADAIARAGGRVLRSHPGLPDLSALLPPYQQILSSVVSRGRPNAQPISAHAYLEAVDAQRAATSRFGELFRDVDVLLAPAFGSVAFPHVDEPDWSKRAFLIDGAATGYRDQLAWPSIALFAQLPATAFPAGATAEGLPIGLQAIGPYLEDLTPLAFVAAVERELGVGFRAPPLEVLATA